MTVSLILSRIFSLYQQLSGRVWLRRIRQVRYPDKGLSVDGPKRKFKKLHIKRIPTGDLLFVVQNK